VLQRILLIVVILLVIWRILAAWGKRLVRGGMGADSYSRFSPFERRKRRSESATQASEPEELVACSSCGTYIPLRRALTSGADHRFCSEECRGTVDAPSENDGRDA
jgi:ribosomal protein L32